MNMRKIAKLAGVSVTTVSRAINKPELVNEETLRRIRQIMDKHNYHVNPFARNLINKKTKNIVMMIPNASNPFHLQVAEGAEEVLAAAGYILTIYNIRKNIDRQSTLLEYVRTKKNSFFMDGLIIVGSGSLQEGYQKALKNIMQTPIVAIDPGPVEKGIDTVYTDEEAGILLAMKYLSKKGHSSIGLVAGEQKYKLTQSILKEIKRFSKLLNIKIEEENIVYGSYASLESGYSVSKKIIYSSKPPSAIVAFNGILAIGTMRYLLENKYRVPEDFAVISCGDIPFNGFYYPGITSVQSPAIDLGKKAAELLLKKIKNPELQNQNILLPPSLVVRESC
jgi:LacI family transcriptional regulator